MSKSFQVIEAVENWFRQLPIAPNTGGFPARGSIAAALVVLDRLKENYTLKLDDHRASGKAQIKGLTSSSVQKILSRYGETRKFLGEGGRTNRGGPAAVQQLLDCLKPLNLNRESESERVELLEKIQKWLVDKVNDYFNRRRLEIIFDPQKTT